MNEQNTVIITAQVHPYLITALQQKGYAVQYLPDITYNELLPIIHVAKGLVITTRLKIDQPLLNKASALQWIGRLGSGMELVDTLYAHQLGIACISTPEGNSNAVAEHALGLLLNLLNNITPAYLQIRQGHWIRHENRGSELSGKTVGIIGYGNTGSAFAKLLQCFGTTVLAYDKYKTSFGQDNIKESGLADITHQADIISFHVPLTQETRFFGNEKFFSSLQKQPYIINTSRGEILHTAHLIHALQHNQIAGAALDVLENEKLETLSKIQQRELAFLANHKKVIITPHIAGYSHEAFYKMSVILLKKLSILKF